MSKSEDARKKRLAKQLRANLMRRKAQARERQEDSIENELQKPDIEDA